MVLMITVMMATMSFASVMVLYRSSFDEYRKAVYNANLTQARSIAQSGTELIIKTLNDVRDTDLLYRLGFFSLPVAIPLGTESFTYQISEESGKLNINRLVNFASDDENAATYNMFRRLSVPMGLPAEIWDAVVDYIDENNNRMPSGYENDDYLRLNPPRRIKNNRIQSLEELLLVPGFDYRRLYQDRRTEEEKKRFSGSFLSDAERASRSDADFVLANNITSYLPLNPSGSGTGKVNINTAPYHVLLSLSDDMVPASAMAVLKRKVERGRFKGVQDLKAIPELNRPIASRSGAILADELALRVVFQDSLYKIVTEAAVSQQRANVLAIYDLVNRRIVTYSE